MVGFGSKLFVVHRSCGGISNYDCYLVGVFDTVEKARAAIEECTKTLLQEHVDRLSLCIEEQEQYIKLIEDIQSKTFELQSQYDLIGDFLISEVKLNVLDVLSCH